MLTLKRAGFVGEDYPMYYPLDIRDVLLVPEETAHYAITGPDADAEWQSAFPPGGGFVCLGPERRPFGLALYHQMHCLDRIRRGIGKNGYNPHVHHCINYLRQAILCEGDTTIEPGVPNLGDKVVRTTVQRTCRDWTQVYEAAKGACGGRNRGGDEGSKAQ
ncbi:hypothetical protein LXA43DRAFT_903912 [Ganoderma leucocontextum]|nr:hypothetical protein LXA43DRAFT_903912 [Ganoderma leucocontextum]